mmetsp:Transcript_7641/g.10486  ORF Transcript_7641/g.10486 Transcript_7641/m.10486 type:complete len:208 (-) Transcript_7641:94-717(-)|eukprot:CAMPEP_0185280166 /NCGR_PEP_ID=MMETSP1359-20130426/65435_1 /TAXON_ID=552665 /ORGANISM="Bigelowiella longifila, Strain CCMP242" /LENGTH=207 /DNA_ID=CAMNT_0027875307 /DNA_START=85 /DNA_END=708 /DNA_ORIENTATION=-
MMRRGPRENDDARSFRNKVFTVGDRIQVTNPRAATPFGYKSLQASLHKIKNMKGTISVFEGESIAVIKINDKRRRFLRTLAMRNLQSFFGATGLDNDIVSVIGGYLTRKVFQVYVYKPQSLFQVPLSSIKRIDEKDFRRPELFGKKLYPGMATLYRRHGDIEEWLKRIDVDSWSSKRIQHTKNYNRRLKEHWEKVYGTVNPAPGVLF